MKIIIDNVKFGYDIGCRLLKLKHEDCPIPELEDIWNDIVPLSFKDIATFGNIEERRVAINCMGLERITKEVKPKLINKQTLKKTTTFVDVDGNLITNKFNDTYELYEVSEKYLNEGNQDKYSKIDTAYFVKCKDTSTNRTYFIWVSPRSVYTTNNEDYWDFDISKVNAIQSIAWTIQTNIPKKHIEKIVRQGDCVLIKPKGKYELLITPRHLTEKEYKTLLVAES